MRDDARSELRASRGEMLAKAVRFGIPIRCSVSRERIASRNPAVFLGCAGIRAPKGQRSADMPHFLACLTSSTLAVVLSPPYVYT